MSIETKKITEGWVWVDQKTGDVLDITLDEWGEMPLAKRPERHGVKPIRVKLLEGDHA